MSTTYSGQPLHIRFIGSAGVPNRYGGFESFLEHCAPAIAAKGHQVQVTCDARLYYNHTTVFKGVERVFLSVPANGGWSLIHDMLAFCKTFKGATHVIVLGVSGGMWFPLFRLLCGLTGKCLLLNVDGIEWRRTKFGKGKRLLLRLLDLLAQSFAHTVIYDNVALRPYLIEKARSKAICIAYSGDHVLRLPGVTRSPDTALTICRIEPENNLEMLIEGVLLSKTRKYTIVGNWSNSPYSRELRQRNANEERLTLLDPIYDADQLAQLRETCAVYIHGHSVGGTNPSLVEMLFYDCPILCFDVDFNRRTAEDGAHYFKNAKMLASQIEAIPKLNLSLRRVLRERYSSACIVNQYLKAMQEGSTGAI